MPSFVILLLMSLSVASNQAKDKSQSKPVAADNKPAAKAQTVAKDKGGDDQSADASPNATHSVSLSKSKPQIPPALAIIEEAARGLLVQSEIDAPLVVKFFESEKIELTPSEVAALVEQKADKPIEIKTVAQFFQTSALVEDWMSADDKAMALRFQRFVATLETNLDNPQAYIIGERERTVVVMGKVKGGFGGVITLVVET